MTPHVTKLADAFSLLGLSEGCTLDELKSAYRQHALRTHPDKNPGNPEATAQFQRVGEAYKIIETHIERPKFAPRGFNPFFDGADLDEFDDEFYEYADSDFDYSDEDYDSDSEYGYYRMPRSFMEFMFLFEQINSGHYRCNCPQHRREPREPPQEYAARMKRAREEQLAAEARRTAEAAASRERRAKEREKEKIDAERRQKDKAQRKKAQAEVERKEAQEKIRSQQQRTQELRSGVFAAARNGDIDKVKNGIWKNGVDAAGGEVKYEEFAQTTPQDISETLLHIAAKAGKTALFEWLDAHNAEPDEQDFRGYTPLHTALVHGHTSIVKHVFNNYPPKEEDHRAIYYTPSCSNLLSLAIKSGEPELVWMILDNGLFTPEDVSSGWSMVSQPANAKKGKIEDKNGKTSDILKLLERLGDFSLPQTPAAKHSQEDRNDTFQTQTKRSGERRGRGRVGPQQSSRPDHLKVVDDNKKQEQAFQANRGNGRGRGRGRGRGHSRGRGSGRGHTRPI
ncbi:hypothetical protein NP233_g10633 [Leucocoprinus birnbaumii]|uniref:J domain-containing protein n=1 Tax=Leucocoprinus birnbaumii TaxID=56174 RepID=A0AAD5VHX6_9AGAR|nr:hypothetical protein NP233_g10633 [Leucocoprinus birnbaumii]